MHLGEAILADLRRLSREANDLVKISVQDGTKCGRAGASASRWIAVHDNVQGALAFARQVLSSDSRNLIAPDESSSISYNESSALLGLSCMRTTSKASMSYERRTHVSATSRSPNAPRQSMMANVAR